MSAVGEFTFRRQYGMVNKDRRDPIVEHDGTAWCTQDGLPVVVPDQWLSDQLKGFEYKKLPHGIEAIEMSTGNKVTVSKKDDDG